MQCSMCGKATSHKKYTKCPSCSHLGLVSNSKYDNHISVPGHKLYPLYKSIVHQTTIDASTQTEPMVRHLLSTYTEEYLEDKILMRQDTDQILSPTNYRLTTTRLRGLAKKAEGTKSKYIGVAVKKTKSGIIRYWATLKGKYIPGSSTTDEIEAAAIRDNYIIDKGLQNDYRLNFS